MNPPPPPPPPHGSNAGNRNGLPDGNYDIFIIPPHSSGSGFLYLPSLQPQWNSFLAGVMSTLLAVIVAYIVIPQLKEWYIAIVAGGGASVIILLMVVGFGAWAIGHITAATGGATQGGPGGAPRAHTAGGSNQGHTPGPTPQYEPPPEPPKPPPPKPTWQRANTGPANGTANTSSTKGGWEKAREETRKKEEERRKLEELRKKREEDEKERVRLREKEARERDIRERRERLDKERAERVEKAEKAERAERASRPASPTKNHRHPTAKTATDDDAYSYRPYDHPKKPSHKATSATTSYVYSESSYAPSQSTSRTTPPPSHRGPYRSKDPDKVVLKAVYSFNNTFTKTPIAKLVSGVGSVTDGLILRITTEGLFIDDDVRGVPQREWDVKAWTLKLVEVWCPHLHALGASSGSTPASRNAVSGLFGKKWSSKAPTNEETDAFLDASIRACKPYLRPGSGSSVADSIKDSNRSSLSQSGEFKGLHVLRASIRDQEGKRYVFFLQEEEGWKVAVGLQRLRRGTQVRSLGVSGMAANETKAILESMGWV